LRLPLLPLLPQRYTSLPLACGRLMTQGQHERLDVVVVGGNAGRSSTSATGTTAAATATAIGIPHSGAGGREAERGHGMAQVTLG
jgi:hypothetical protein